MTRLEAQRIDDDATLAALAPAWERSRQDSPQPSFQDSLADLRHQAGRRPHTRVGAIALTDGAETIGVVPTLAERELRSWKVRLPRRTLTPVRVPLDTVSVPSETLLVPDTDEAHRVALSGLLVGHGRADVIRFPAVRVGSRLDAHLDALDRRESGRWVLRAARADRRLQIRFGDASFDEYLAGRLHRQERTNLRRDAKRLLGAGLAEATCTQEPDDVDRYVDQVADVWAHSWHVAAGGKPIPKARLRDDLRWAAGQGRLRGWLLQAADGPIAFLLAHAADDTLWIEKMGFDAAWRPYAPGKTLLVHAIREAHGSGCRLVDFGYGDYPYKARLANAELSTRAADLVLSGFRPMAACLPPAAYSRVRATGIRALEASGLGERARLVSTRRLGR